MWQVRGTQRWRNVIPEGHEEWGTLEKMVCQVALSEVKKREAIGRHNRRRLVFWGAC